MGNIHCPDAAHLFTVARDFCPFPDYSPSPLLNILTAESSLHLSQHYASVQASLTPQQKQDFTQTLRSTFGREGKVSNGGVGVVALSLAVLFDSVARQVKGEYESDQEPIPGLFLRDPTGTYPEHVYTISKYLRLVPHIANNPTRMRDEAEKYLNKLMIEDFKYNVTGQDFDEDLTSRDSLLITSALWSHLELISNKTRGEFPKVKELPALESFNRTNDPKVAYNLNCDLEAASQRFVSALDSFSTRTKEALKTCDMSGGQELQLIVLHHYLGSIFHRSLMSSAVDFEHLQDFDLKAKALGRWI